MTSSRSRQSQIPELDLNDARFADPNEFLNEIRNVSPLVRTAHGFAVLDHATCESLLTDSRLSTDHQGVVDGLGFADPQVAAFERRTLPSLHGEAHRRMRAPLAHMFGRRRSENMRPLVRDAISQCITEIESEDTFDLYEVFCRRVPATLYALWTETPLADRDFVAQLSRTALSVFSERPECVPEVEDAYRRMFGYIDAQLARAGTPFDESTLLGELLRECASRQMTDSEVRDHACVLLEASVENTAHQIGLVFKCLLERPEVWHRLLQDRQSIPCAVKEAIRLEPRTQSVDRRTLCQIEVHGRSISADTPVALWVSAAQRDPSAYSGGDEFDLDRAEPSGSLNFGGGPTHCIGSQVAQIEIEECLVAIQARLPDLHLVAPVATSRSAFLYDIVEIPVSADP